MNKLFFCYFLLLPVQVLEQRFHQAIEPGISSALAARQADRVASLARLMVDADRKSELDSLYVASRLPMLQVRGCQAASPWQDEWVVLFGDVKQIDVSRCHVE
jgi:hypothetical protein